MTDKCDLVLTLDNKAPVVNLTIPNVLNECGVIKRSSITDLNLGVNVFQENGRLNSWGFSFTMGVVPTPNPLDSSYATNGWNSTADSDIVGAATNKTVSANALLDEVDEHNSTCAFALKLTAQAHIRNGYYFIYQVEQIKAIAIENCVCP
jgi:hypothetical protein